MINVSRRDFMAGAAGALLASGLPFRVIAAEHDALRIAISVETGNLDLLQNVSGLNTYTLVFDPLIRYGQGGELLPALAESWDVSGDGKTITLKLREGVTFSDGTPFDAAAAEWNLKRWMGKPDFSWIGVSDAMESIATEGSHTIRINLKQPVPAALLELTIVRPVRFLSPKAVDASGNQSAPIGTGAWVIQKNDNAETVLIRNESYWGEKPAFSRIDLKVVPDELARANALRSGELDVTGGDWVSPLSPRRARALESDASVKVFAESGTTTMLLGYSPKAAAVADKAVREAIYLGIDRAAMAKVLFEGFADPIADVFPAVIPLSGTRHDVPARQVDAAKAALRAGGWTEAGSGWEKSGTPLELEFLVSEESLPGSRRIAEMIQGQLAEIGIKVNVSSVDNATMHERRPAFEYDLTFFTTYGAPYDPHGTLGNLFVSTVDSGPDGKIYASPELDPIVQAALAADGEERAVKMQAIYDWLDSNRAVCPLVAPQRLWAHGRRVATFALPPTDYDMPYEGITLTS